MYVPDSNPYTIDLSEATGEFGVYWYNPLKGGELQPGSVKRISGGSIQNLGIPEMERKELKNQDWVVLLKRSKT